MKINEIISSYKSGERVFENLNINNLSFRGQNLANSIFRNCKINSTNFSHANLTNSKFIKCQTGLSNFWLFCLIISLFLISLSQGVLLFCITLMEMYLKSETNILFSFFLYLSLIIILLVTISTPYIKKNFLFRLFNLPILLLVINGILGLIAGYKILPTLLVLGFFGAINGLVTGFLLISLAISFTIVILNKNQLILGLLIIGIIITSLVIANFFLVIKIPTLIASIYMISLALYLSYDALKTKSESWLYPCCLWLIAKKNTKFYQTNLSNAKFEETYLEYCDLRKANLTNLEFENINNGKNLVS